MSDTTEPDTRAPTRMDAARDMAIKKLFLALRFAVSDNLEVSHLVATAELAFDEACGAARQPA